jgi:hypothetical protein
VRIEENASHLPDAGSNGSQPPGAGCSLAVVVVVSAAVVAVSMTVVVVSVVVSDVVAGAGSVLGVVSGAVAGVAGAVVSAVLSSPPEHAATKARETTTVQVERPTYVCVSLMPPSRQTAGRNASG